MGGCCNRNVNNTLFAERIKKYTMAIKDVKSMQNKLKVDSNYPIYCFLVSAKSCPNFLDIIRDSLNGDIIDIQKLTEYQLEKNIQIYGDPDNCKNIYKKNKNNNENNEFIIVSGDFLKNMEIEEGKEVKLEKENSEIKAIFDCQQNNRIKMVIKENNSPTYHFSACEGESLIDKKNTLLAEPYNNINNKDSFLLKSLIDCLKNFDLFKNILIKNEQTIKNNRIQYPISNNLLIIMKKGDKNEDKIRERKEFINLNKILYNENELVEPKSLIFSLINKLSKEYNFKPNPITELFGIKEAIYYNCPNCIFQVSNTYNSCCMEFNLEKVRKFKLQNSENFFLNLDIDDCFSYNKNNKISSNYFCQSCNTKINNNKFYNIEIFPNILIIILDRENKIRTNDRIEFNIEFKNNESILDLSNLSNRNYKIIYDLIGVFSYKQEEDNVDNFYNTVFCKMNNNNWIYYDKYLEKPIENMDIKIMHTPYMLFYLRKNNA